jgi:hypothetical protein
MNWNAFIDSYCERLIPGFWDEPLNALSNLAFWFAAGWVWHRWQQQMQAENRFSTLSGSMKFAPDSVAKSRHWDIHVLLIMLVLIGAGSFAFHTFATRWAAALDVLFIALYLHFYLAVYMHRVGAIPWPRAAWGILAFLVLSQTAAWIWGQVAIAAGGGLPQLAGAARGYLGAWSVLLLLVAHSWHRRLPFAPHLAAASIVFVLSLIMRQLDLPLCSDWRWGTHFVWHLLNALTLGLTSLAMVKASSPHPSGLKLKP